LGLKEFQYWSRAASGFIAPMTPCKMPCFAPECNAIRTLISRRGCHAFAAEPPGEGLR
jgi:hypothetical protein